MQNSNIKNMELIHDIVPLLLWLVLDNHSRIVDVGVCAMMMALGFERTLRHTPIKLAVILAIRCSISPARYARGVGSLPKTKEDRALIRAARGWEPRSCFHSVCVWRWSHPSTSHSVCDKAPAQPQTIAAPATGKNTQVLLKDEKPKHNAKTRSYG